MEQLQELLEHLRAKYPMSEYNKLTNSPEAYRVLQGNQMVVDYVEAYINSLELRLKSELLKKHKSK